MFKEVFNKICEGENHYQHICDTLEDLNGSLNLNMDQLLIMHINIRSLDKNFEELYLLIQSLQTKPHHVIVCETWNLT